MGGAGLNLTLFLPEGNVTHNVRSNTEQVTIIIDVILYLLLFFSLISLYILVDRIDITRIIINNCISLILIII